MNCSVLVKVVPWFFSAICVVLIAVFSYFSFTSDKLVLETFCRSPEAAVFWNEPNATLDQFREWAENVSDRLYVVISVQGSIERQPDAFTDVLERARDRGVEIKIYSNNANISLPGAKVKYFPRKEKMMVNFALGDSSKVFVPSSFFSMSDKPTITHMLRFDNCSSAGQEVASLFEMIWDTPEGDRKTAVKRRWIVRNGYYNNHNGVNFLFGPTSLYPMNRTTTCATNISHLLGNLAMERSVVSSSLYPSHVSGFSGALDATIVTGMFEQMDSFQSKKAIVYTMRDHLVQNKEQVRSLLVNMEVAPRNELYECSGLEIEGTVAYTNNLGYLLMPCGIGEVFDDKHVLLGVTSNNKTNVLHDVLGNLKKYCHAVKTPVITQTV